MLLVVVIGSEAGFDEVTVVGDVACHPEFVALGRAPGQLGMGGTLRGRRDRFRAYDPGADAAQGTQDHGEPLLAVFQIEFESGVGRVPGVAR